MIELRSAQASSMEPQVGRISANHAMETVDMNSIFLVP